jgi:predicted TIM-barrel fold metal-dependent hydrolase
VEQFGSGRLVFSTDYPHGDSKYPEAVNHFLKLPIADEHKRKILWDNCAAYYAM